MKPYLLPCAALIIAIGGAASGHAAQAPAAAGPATSVSTEPARAPVPATTGPTPPADATVTAGPVTTTPPPPSQSPRDQLDAERESRARYAVGETAFKAGRYLQAVVEFEAGFAAVPKPGFLLNIGHAYRRLGDLHKARAAYKKFLLVDPTSNLHDDVLSLVGELDSALADDDRADRLAAQAIAATLVPPPLDSHAGHAGVNLGAPARSAIPSSENTRRPFYRRAWFWVAVGAVAIGTGVGIYAMQGRSSESVHAIGSLGMLRP